MRVHVPGLDTFPIGDVGVDGKDVQVVGHYEMGRRIPDKEFIPSLADDMVDVMSVSPPSRPDEGWLITVSSESDALHLMNNFSRIPGFTTRWATAQDMGKGFPAGDGYSVQGRSHEHEKAHSQVSTAGDHDAAQHGASAASVVRGPQGTFTPPASPTAEPPSGPTLHTTFDPRYPHLRKAVIHTYKGRILREDTSAGVIRYIDDSAVFVGRLVKGQETTSTLLQRFGRYGRVNNLEYNPSAAQTTYATARILYQDHASALRAIEHETREMYVDDHGRAISPSMASQYTPPSPPIVPVEYTMPLSAGLALPAPQMPPQNSPWYAQPVVSLPPINGWYGLPLALPPLHGAPPPSLMSATPSGGVPAERIPILAPVMMPVGMYPPDPPAVAPPAIRQPLTPSTPAEPIAPYAPNTTPMPPPVPPADGPRNDVSSPPVDQPRSGIVPRVIGHKIEDGVFKPFYDAAELSAWRRANGVPESSVPQHQPRAEEPLRLLPLATGGHEHSPHSPHSAVSIIHSYYGDSATSLVPVPIPFHDTRFYSPASAAYYGPPSAEHSGPHGHHPSMPFSTRYDHQGGPPRSRRSDDRHSWHRNQPYRSANHLGRRQYDERHHDHQHHDSDIADDHRRGRPGRASSNGSREPPGPYSSPSAQSDGLPLRPRQRRENASGSDIARFRAQAQMNA
ncbi:hypothetical protein Q5752_002491 [Cryptotrichosporon argae]